MKYIYLKILHSLYILFIHVLASLFLVLLIDFVDTNILHLSTQGASLLMFIKWFLAVAILIQMLAVIMIRVWDITPE